MTLFRFMAPKVPSLPMVVSLLAVTVAMGGTAVAVAPTVVNIADPTSSSRVAHVNNLGQLQTVLDVTTIDSSSLLSNTAGDNFVTSPTTATLAITKLDLSNPTINNGTTSEVRVYVYKVDVDNSGNCVATAYHVLAIYNVGPGDDITNTFSTPLKVAPTTPSTKYCISLYAVTLGGTYSASYYTAYSFGAYRLAGTYTGAGAAVATAGKPDPAPAGQDR